MARKLGLATDDVLSAAIDIADRNGLASVTLTSVARALDVRTPSLYAHVDGLDGLRRALGLRAATDLTDALTEAREESSGIEALRRIAYAYRQYATQHPGLYAAAQHTADRRTDPVLYDALLAAVAPVFSALEEAGIKNAAEQIHVTRVFRSALHGFVSLEQTGGFGLPTDVDDSFERLVDLLIRGIKPR